MDIIIKISDYSLEQIIVQEINKKINKELDQKFEDVFRNTKIDDLILKRVDYLIDRSKYVSNDIIRNLVQQRIAKEITKDILNGKTT